MLSHWQPHGRPVQLNYLEFIFLVSVQNKIFLDSLKIRVSICLVELSKIDHSDGLAAGQEVSLLSIEG